jgi:hypothetical protein
MGKHYLIGFLACCALSAQAQPYTPNTVERLDDLEQNRILLSKELEVVKLQSELQRANASVGVTTSGANTGGAPLSLIKINGLASNPEAVFLYGGYRVVARKGGMVIPNLQITGVSQSYVVLKDITTGKENVLWLSAGDTSSPSTDDQPNS